MRNTIAAVWMTALMLAAVPAAQATSASAGKLDLNQATLEQIRGLPVSEELARAIVDYRTFVRFFGNVYDLMEVEGMTAADLAALKPLVMTLPPPPADAGMARLAASYEQVSGFLSQEGASEGLVDEYLDLIRDPVDINGLDLFDLMSFQNVSPVDAKAILRARQRLGAFADDRQLRRSDGLSYFAFRNIRDFVVYGDGGDPATADSKVHGSYQLRWYDTPYVLDDSDIAGAGGLTSADAITAGTLLTEGDAHLTQKLTLNLGDGFRAGVLTHRGLGEGSWRETMKGYYGVDDLRFGDLRLKRLYFGNYRVAFGQGLIMDNTDFMMSRKTGFGWNKRPIGVRGDLSRSAEFALTGLAAEASYGRLHGTMFLSWDRKDGILNPDGTVNQYIVMKPRPTDDWLEDHLAYEAGRSYATGALKDTPTLLKRDAFREDIVGGNLKFMLDDASYIGVTAYEAKYDRAFDADPSTLVSYYSLVDRDLLEARDSELWSGYTSVEEDAAAGTRTEHKFRRVYGAEFQTVVDNVSLQGEYGVLQDPTAGWFHGNSPDALVLNAFAQWDDLNLLALYRDYDLAYDNPYNRAFSNDNRYEQTLLDSPFRLNDDLYSWLAVNTPQPKPEQGIFLSTRYRISRTLILNGLEYDQWQRKSDNADLQRYTVRLEYQPTFNLRFRLRHRFSSRSETNPDDVRWFRSWESRFEMIALLSNMNRLRFMYMTSNVMFPPRARLSGTPDGGTTPYEDDGIPGVGTAGMPAHAFQAMYEHRLSPGVSLSLSSEIYNGFVWNFEGNEFVVVDGRGFRNWASIESRVSDRLFFQIKATRDHNLPRTYLDVRAYQDAYGADIESSYAPRDWTTFRMQLDYTF